MTKWTRIDTEDWSALYADGELVQYTDSYIVDEYLFRKVLGGEWVSSDAYYEHNEYGLFEMPQRLEDYLKLLDGGEGESDD